MFAKRSEYFSEVVILLDNKTGPTCPAWTGSCQGRARWRHSPGGAARRPPPPCRTPGRGPGGWPAQSCSCGWPQQPGPHRRCGHCQLQSSEQLLRYIRDERWEKCLRTTNLTCSKRPLWRGNTHRILRPFHSPLSWNIKQNLIRTSAHHQHNLSRN